MNGSQRTNLLAAELCRAEADRVSDDGNLPFYLEPPGAVAAVLLVHGFTATPWEMRPLADDLRARGFASLAVRLPGHGTSPEDLAARRWEEWLDAVVRGYDLLAGHHPRVYAAGLSTGSLLVLALAGERQPAGLVLLSPYLRIRHRLAPFAGWLRFFYPYQQRLVTGPEARYYYARRPVAGVHQINRLQRALWPRLATIRVPVIAIHGEGDRTIDIDSGRRLVERLGSKVRVYERLGPEVPHVLTGAENPQRETVFDLIGNFLGELESQCPGAASR
jgi:carboxylesterase